MPSDAGSLNVTAEAARTGAFGLEVDPGTACTGQDTEVLSNTTVAGVESYEGCDTLVAETNFVISATGQGTLTAGRTVILGSGFRVESGGSLTVQIEPTLQPVAFVQDDTPAAETTYNVEFYLNVNNLSLADGDEIEHFIAHRADGVEQMKIFLRQSTGLEIVLAVCEDGGTFVETSPLTLHSGWNKINASWAAAAGATASLSIDEGTPESLVGLDTDEGRIDFVRWGAVAGAFTRNPGTLHQDDFVSTR